MNACCSLETENKIGPMMQVVELTRKPGCKTVRKGGKLGLSFLAFTTAEAWMLSAFLTPRDRELIGVEVNGSETMLGCRWVKS